MSNAYSNTTSGNYYKHLWSRKNYGNLSYLVQTLLAAGIWEYSCVFCNLKIRELGRETWICHSSYDCRQIFRPVLGGEICAFAACSGHKMIMQNNLQSTVRWKVLITMLIKSESLLKVIVKWAPSNEFTVMKYVEVTREARDQNEILIIVRIFSKKNTADGLAETVTSR